MASDQHNALVSPQGDGYAVSCPCGWLGLIHDTPRRAEREAEHHEADPSADLTPRTVFAQNLRRIRRKSGKSQGEVAALAHVHRTEISALERAEREPRLGTLVKLAAALDVPAHVFTEGIEWAPILVVSKSPARFHLSPTTPDSSPDEEPGES